MHDKEAGFSLYDRSTGVIRSLDTLIRSNDTSASTPASASASVPQLSSTPEEAAHFRRLVEGFEFSRWFYLSYQAAIVGVLGIVTARRWVEQKRRQKRRHRTRTTRENDIHAAVDSIPVHSHVRSYEGKEIATDELYIGPQQTRRGEGSLHSSSPSSSTRGTTSIGCIAMLRCPSPKQEAAHDVSNAASPLLSPVDRQAPRPQRPRPLLVPWHWTRAALMYQPPPLPILRRIIPDNLTNLVILALLGLNLFYLLFNIPFHTISWVDIISDRAGLLWVANLPWLYLLAAKNQPLKRLTGDSYENLNLIHRRQGEWMTFLAVLHFSAMVAAYYLHLQKFGTLWWFLTINYIKWGVFAFVAYKMLCLTSLSSFREWGYELFLASHVFLQALGLALLWLHHFRAQVYIGVSLAIFLLDRIVWRVGIKRMKIKIDLEVMEDGATVRVSGNWHVERPLKRSWKGLLGGGMHQGWLPSQHVFITIPGMSRKHTWQAHPMTIALASPAFDESGHGHAWFNLIIRAKDGFSRELLEHARVFDSATACVEGPYGSLHGLEMLRASDLSVIVAGGSGIAVAYPMLWDLLHRPEDYATQKVCLIWVVQDASHISWIGNSRVEDLRDLGCRVIIPPSSRKHGRPDVCGLLRDCVDEFAHNLEDSIGVVVSGPDALNRDIRNSCAKMVSKGRNVNVFVEKFGW